MSTDAAGGAAPWAKVRCAPTKTSGDWGEKGRETGKKSGDRVFGTAGDDSRSLGVNEGCREAGRKGASFKGQKGEIAAVERG